jgi:hypothetical protein
MKDGYLAPTTQHRLGCTDWLHVYAKDRFKIPHRMAELVDNYVAHILEFDSKQMKLILRYRLGQNNDLQCTPTESPWGSPLLARSAPHLRIDLTLWIVSTAPNGWFNLESNTSGRPGLSSLNHLASLDVTSILMSKRSRPHSSTAIS